MSLPSRLLETGKRRLLETGSRRLLEGVLVPPFKMFGWQVAGKVGKVLGADTLGAHGIWQNRKTRRGKVPIRMKFYAPTNPRTVDQQANRTKFAEAMTAWQALTPEQKKSYNERARKRQMFGHNLFIKEYMHTSS